MLTVTAPTATTTVKPPASVPVPPGVVTETSLDPGVAVALIEMLAVICVALTTVKELTVIPSPKLTAVAPVRLVPPMVTSSVSSCSPELGLTEATVGGRIQVFSTWFEVWVWSCESTKLASIMSVPSVVPI